MCIRDRALRVDALAGRDLKDPAAPPRRALVELGEAPELVRAEAEVHLSLIHIWRTFSRITPEQLFRMWRTAPYSPCKSLMKCSVPFEMCIRDSHRMSESSCHTID